jgi:hypothetical protein
MDHIRLYTKDRKDDECEIVVHGHCNALAWVARVFARVTICIYRSRHARGCKDPWRAGTDDYLQVIVIGLGKRLVIMEPDDNAARFILDGWDACGIDLFIIALAAAISPVTIQVCAITKIIISGTGITYTEARGVLDDQPGKEEPGELEHTHEDQKQKG